MPSDPQHPQQFAETVREHAQSIRWFQQRIDALEEEHHRLLQSLIDTQAALRKALGETRQFDGDRDA